MSTGPTPLVTVITAVKDGARHLRSAIDSVQRQSVADWEYIIVDDGSEDDSYAIAHAAAEEDNRIRVIRRAEAAGPYIAANDGVREARGRYIARLDADDVSRPDRFAVQLRFLEERPTLRACGAYHTEFGPGSQYPGLEHRIPASPGTLKWHLAMGGGPLHSTALVERTVFDELGGYPAFRFAQDRWLWCRLAESGWVGVVPTVLVERRVHEDRLTNAFPVEQLRAALNAAADHLHRLTGQTWSLDEIEALWHVASRTPGPVRPALRALRRWGEAWRSDLDLRPEERDELARREWSLRRKLLLRTIREGGLHDRSAALGALMVDGLRAARRRFAT